MLEDPRAPVWPMLWFAYSRLSDVNKSEATDLQRCRPSMEQLDAEWSLGCPITYLYYQSVNPL